jgi:hypothetical protein
VYCSGPWKGYACPCSFYNGAQRGLNGKNITRFMFTGMARPSEQGRKCSEETQEKGAETSPPAPPFRSRGCSGTYHHEPIGLIEWSKVDTLRLCKRPHTDHHFDSHVFQLLHHSYAVDVVLKLAKGRVGSHGSGGRTSRVRPALGVEMPVSKVDPVEVVDDDDRNGKSTRDVLLCDRQQLGLVAVSDG